MAYAGGAKVWVFWELSTSDSAIETMALQIAHAPPASGRHDPPPPAPRCFGGQAVRAPFDQAPAARCYGGQADGAPNMSVFIERWLPVLPTLSEQRGIRAYCIKKAKGIS